MDIALTHGLYVKHREWCAASHDKYLKNRLEQDHRGIKQRHSPMYGFSNFQSAARFCRAFDELRTSFDYSGQTVCTHSFSTAFVARSFRLEGIDPGGFGARDHNTRHSMNRMCFYVLSSDRIAVTMERPQRFSSHLAIPGISLNERFACHSSRTVGLVVIATQPESE